MEVKEEEEKEKGGEDTRDAANEIRREPRELKSRKSKFKVRMINCAECYETRGSFRIFNFQECFSLDFSSIQEENTLSAFNSSEFYYRFLEKSYFISRAVNDFLPRKVTVIRATSEKHPMDKVRWPLTLVSDASAAPWHTHNFVPYHPTFSK